MDMITGLIAVITFVMGIFVGAYIIQDAQGNIRGEKKDNIPDFNHTPPTPMRKSRFMQKLDDMMAKSKEEKLPIRENHMEPEYYGYKGGYADINKCSDCNYTGLYEDLYSSDPCPRCGGDIHSDTPSKWGIKDGLKQWIPKPDKK